MHAKHSLLFYVLIFSSIKFLCADDESSTEIPILDPLLEQISEILSGDIQQNDTENSDEPTCDDCSEKSLSFHTATTESWTLNHTGKSIDLIGDPSTNGTITGGVFGSDLYKFIKLQYDWEICGDNITFEIRDYFSNTKYGSFDNSLNYPDGLIQVFVPVNANDDVDNPSFNAFEETIKPVKKPGDTVTVHSKDSFYWFKNFPIQATYYYYKSSFFNEEDGQTYNCATTVELPIEKNSNYVSTKQFKNAFGHMVDESGRPLNNLIPPKDPPKSDVQQGTGIKVTDV